MRLRIEQGRDLWHAAEKRKAARMTRVVDFVNKYFI
jgi:hypothetical protein